MVNIIFTYINADLKVKIIGIYTFSSKKCQKRDTESNLGSSNTYFMFNVHISLNNLGLLKINNF